MVLWFNLIPNHLDTRACIYTHNEERVEMGEDVLVDEEDSAMELQNKECHTVTEDQGKYEINTRQNFHLQSTVTCIVKVKEIFIQSRIFILLR